MTLTEYVIFERLLLSDEGSPTTVAWREVGRGAAASRQQAVDRFLEATGRGPGVLGFRAVPVSGWGDSYVEGEVESKPVVKTKVVPDRTPGGAAEKAK